MAFDYKKWYVYRRNKLCIEHNTVLPKGRCEQCKAIATSRPQLYREQLESDERLALASYLEYKVALGKLDIMEARYRLVDEFPETNCIPTTYDKTDYSVINLIRPYYTTVRELSNKRRIVMKIDDVAPNEREIGLPDGFREYDPVTDSQPSEQFEEQYDPEFVQEQDEKLRLGLISNSPE